VKLPPTERTALKEWAVMVDALGCGDIIGIVRKGGIRDQRGGFHMRHSRFLFYPTRFHQSVDQLSERFVPRLSRSHAAMAPSGLVRIEYVAQPAISWSVSDFRRLAAARHELGLSESALQSRFNYREPGAEFIALRVERLIKPVVIPDARRYAGCVSWLELDEPIACDAGDVAPVMSESEFQDRLFALVPVLCDGEIEVVTSDDWG
jgi:hypothetical protein